MKSPLRILHLEDDPNDCALVQSTLEDEGINCAITCVQTRDDFVTALDRGNVDLILSDYGLPTFDGFAALEIAQKQCPEIPFILVSGMLGEEAAVAAMKSGATDYLLKDRLARLGQSVGHALEQSSMRKERVSAEEAMQQSEHKYRHLFESLSEAAFLIDAKSRCILDANLSAEKLLGKTRTEILGMNEAKLFPPNEAADYWRRLASGGTLGKGELDEAALQCKDGITTIPVRLSLAPIELHGRDLVLALMVDVTERKRSEECLREQADMLSRAQDAIIAHDFDSRRITFWNSGAERLYGWSAEEATSWSTDKRLYVDAKDRAELLETLSSRGEFRGELKQVTKDGREVIVDSRVTLIRHEDGSPRSVLAINTDITEYKKLETQFLRAQRLESIGILAGGVAHDLNNILTPILICAEALRGDMTAVGRESALALIEESAERGANVVKQVLTFARGIEGERVSITPNHLVHEMVDIARRTFPKSIEITSRCPEDIWSIKGDPTQLHQVMLNISVNARDAMPSGGKLVFGSENFEVDEQYAAMTPEAAPGPHVLLQISDNGGGMPRETIDKIFDPFFTTKGLGKGTGLGLSTAVGIVKSHGGFISVHSDVGKGTIFKIFLPAEVGAQSLAPAETRVAPTQGNGELVLVVDDEENILRATKAVLEKHNYRVVLATDGAEAVALFAQRIQDIRVVLTDILMPHMDGMAAVRALRKMKPSIPIIACTGEAQQARFEELRAMNVDNFLVKPFSTASLLGAIHASVGACNGVEAEVKAT